MAGRRTRRGPRRLLIVLLCLAVVGALGVGLSRTYAEQERLEAPTGLTAKPLTPTSVELDWRGSDNAEEYVVRVGPDRALTRAVTAKVKARDDRRRTTLTLSDVRAAVPGVEQYYRVDAIKDGKVRSSRIARFRLKPAPVRRLKVTTVTPGGIKATWRRTPNARQFDVSIARDKRFTKKATTVRTLGTGRTFITNGLRPDTAYWIRVRAVNGDQVGAFTRPVTFTTGVRESSFRVGTWNVCSEKCSDYPSRARIMASFINANKIDIFGLQEAGGERVGATTNAIFTGGSQGFVRAEGGARARYIFYRSALFEQISGGSFPIGDGRDTTWAKFRTRDTGRTFYFVDVHLENGKSADANAKRSREMDVMLGRMAQINDTGTPMIYAGDFNSGTHRAADAPGVKMRAAGFANSFLQTKDVTNGRISTSHTFATTLLAAGAHVDHIWVSKDFDVESWAQLVRLDGGSYARPVTSDHNLLSAVVALDAAKASLGDPTPTTTVGELTP
ncbi:hypothetical protein GEV29_01350 [Aeromicrobium sp. SMF47]|uniref:Uncharacterized protein n=1 Tax=Aeromicrobium yanjiei TaxID=2662028 RepID=A0A5Q2MFD1_9ACTN|nr:endonuclease/exonuclease/phosphatase family protein [Aeromicrobium yanjiei]MRJ75174.1 hypothetical protein [Aeromicrobium yanjiei]QGG40371.1 hypothetical protein GEV26_02735 [Aeromicrobium yanjiei]